MRGKITDQDLTDYALNELGPADRLYLESMLAVSDECRNDVCHTIEMARILEEGFEREIVAAERKELALRPDQREHLAKPHFTLRYMIRDIASALTLAACVAFAITKLDHYDFSNARQAAGRMAHVSSNKASGAMTAAVQATDTIDFAKYMVSLRSLAEEGARKTNDILTDSPTICTPPTLMMESAQLTGFMDMTPP